MRNGIERKKERKTAVIKKNDNQRNKEKERMKENMKAKEKVDKD